jgi:hypothetical protein
MTRAVDDMDDDFADLAFADGAEGAEERLTVDLPADQAGQRLDKALALFPAPPAPGCKP